MGKVAKTGKGLRERERKKKIGFKFNPFERVRHRQLESRLSAKQE